MLVGKRDLDRHPPPDLRAGMATHVFDPIVIVAGLIPFIGMILVLLLVRNTKATEAGLVRPI